MTIQHKKYKFIFDYNYYIDQINIDTQINDHWKLCGGHVSKLNNSYYGNDNVIKLFYLTSNFSFDFIISDSNGNDVLDEL